MKKAIKEKDFYTRSGKNIETKHQGNNIKSKKRK